MQSCIEQFVTVKFFFFYTISHVFVHLSILILLSIPLFMFSLSISPGQQVIEEQRRRLAELKQKAAAEAQFQWEALHGSHTLLSSSPAPPLVHHSILHHTAPSAGEDNYDTLSLESSDSIDTSVSTSNNSACSPDNMSRLENKARRNLTVCPTWTSCLQSSFIYYLRGVLNWACQFLQLKINKTVFFPTLSVGC